MENTDAALLSRDLWKLVHWTWWGGGGGGALRWYTTVGTAGTMRQRRVVQLVVWTNVKSQSEIHQDVLVEWLLAGGRRVQLRQPKVHVLLVGRHRQYLIETLHQLVEHGSLVWMVTPTVPHYHISVEDNEWQPN